MISEIILEGKKIYYLYGNIIYFSIGAWEQKLCPNKLKIGARIRNGGQQKKFKI